MRISSPLYLEIRPKNKIYFSLSEMINFGVKALKIFNGPVGI